MLTGAWFVPRDNFGDKLERQVEKWKKAIACQHAHIFIRIVIHRVVNNVWIT